MRNESSSSGDKLRDHVIPTLFHAKLNSNLNYSGISVHVTRDGGSRGTDVEPRGTGKELSRVGQRLNHMGHGRSHVEWTFNNVGRIRVT